MADACVGDDAGADAARISQAILKFQEYQIPEFDNCLVHRVVIFFLYYNFSHFFVVCWLELI